MEMAVYNSRILLPTLQHRAARRMRYPFLGSFLLLPLLVSSLFPYIVHGLSLCRMCGYRSRIRRVYAFRMRFNAR